jgi:hypothetical protein
MNMITTFPSARGPRGAVAAVMTAILLAATATAVRAEESLVAYSDASPQVTQADKHALDRAISDAAEQANAALTEDMRVELENRVRSKLRLARVRTAARG